MLYVLLHSEHVYALLHIRYQYVNDNKDDNNYESKGGEERENITLM